MFHFVVVCEVMSYLYFYFKHTLKEPWISLNKANLIHVVLFSGFWDKVSKLCRPVFNQLYSVSAIILNNMEIKLS